MPSLSRPRYLLSTNDAFLLLTISRLITTDLVKGIPVAPACIVRVTQLAFRGLVNRDEGGVTREARIYHGATTKGVRLNQNVKISYARGG